MMKVIVSACLAGNSSSSVLIDKQVDECYYSMLVITNHIHEKSELL